MAAAFLLDHVALVVRDPARTAHFLEGIFGTHAESLHDEDGHDEVSVPLAGIPFVLVAADIERPLTGDHIAFSTSPERMRAIAAKLKAMGRDHQFARADTALYFQDFDNHVFEIDASRRTEPPGAVPRITVSTAAGR